MYDVLKYPFSFYFVITMRVMCI